MYTGYVLVYMFMRIMYWCIRYTPGVLCNDEINAYKCIKHIVMYVEAAIYNV